MRLYHVSLWHEVSSGVRGTEGTTLDGFNRLDFHAVPNCGMSFELDDAPAVVR